MPSDIKYNVGIIGFGMIGKVHSWAYASLPFHMKAEAPKTRISYVVTGHNETAAAAKKLVGADVATTDWRMVTENPAIDIVHICTPNALHIEPLLSAMKHNKHIYCEKPLVDTMAEAEQVRAALGEYRGTAQMVFHYRFYPATMRAKQLIDEGAVGEVLEFRVSYMQCSQADPETPFRWKSSRVAGGGVLPDIGSHALDIAEWLAGPFAEISAATHIGFTQRRDPNAPSNMLPVDAEDSISAMVRLPNGALGTIQATKLATGTENELTVEIFGTRGAIRFDGMDPHHIWYYDTAQPESPMGGRRGWCRIDTGHRYEEPDTTFPATKSNVGWLRAHASSLVHFIDAIENNRPAQPGLDRGIEVQHLIQCVRKSDADKRWVGV